MTDKPDQPIRLRISGGPSLRSIKILDNATGRPVAGVRAVRFEADVSSTKPATVTLEVIDYELSVVALQSERRKIVLPEIGRPLDASVEG